MPSWNVIVEDPLLWRGLAIGFVAGLVASRPLWKKFKQTIRELDDKLNTDYEVVNE